MKKLAALLVVFSLGLFAVAPIVGCGGGDEKKEDKKEEKK